ncbi:hypothetical protein RAZWK3B_14544 [Roseobacter sp. AzwK-3b]|uniref:hypothetical protein n=1 Tax=Roseobacter sp. AzwK-3b TaxID=351016 RepID=UPI0001568C44|nr:hypothetical protein [Roseobacter sp. AzwK-3b]EDM71448.1 hypothetical protein RAZWK3B_14544 [Roseobacter sp. AzwK-3b]
MSKKLSPRSRTVLEAIASGLSYAQIIERNPSVTYPDIFAAAKEALDLEDSVPSKAANHIDAARSQYPNAYQPWSSEDDVELVKKVRNGDSVETLSVHFGRQPSAIRSRISKLLPPEDTFDLIER